MSAELVPVEPVTGVVVETPRDLPALAPQPIPADQDPYLVYLGSLPSAESRRSMQGALDRIARLLLGVDLTDTTVIGRGLPWWDLRYQHTARLRTLIIEQGWSPAYGSKHLVALRRVLKEAWRLGQMSAEDYHRAADVAKIDGEREVAGRMLDRGEIAAHLDACVASGTVKGIRDAALLAVANATGARRQEIVLADLADWDARDGLRFHGKGNKVRRVPLAPWALPYLAAWLQVRGRRPGPLFTRVYRSGKVTLNRLTAQTILDVLKARAVEAGTAPASPHDMRRTFASTLLGDPETDLVVVSKLMGHSQVTTTARYDRRPAEAAAAAIQRLPDPHTF